MELNALIRKVQEYMPQADVGLIERAYAFAEKAHEGQSRRSGEAYIQHPLQAASIAAEMQLDPVAIAAALLHDVSEDTGVSLEEVRQQFGDRVAQLVEGVTKLGKINWVPWEGATDEEKREVEKATRQKETHAEHLRKMFLAMADDVRVVLIKLADRLHNMRTLSALTESQQARIAQETLEIFAPLASRLGIWQLKWELEDLSFRYLHPQEYREVAALLASRRQSRERYIGRVMKVLSAALAQASIAAELYGRPKHIYSIYKKMQEKGREFDQIYDALAVRIIVDEIKDCYAALGVVHSLWRPIPGEFDDYIAMPKESMYQSLHTAVISLDGKPLEIQIRTHEMHRVAEYGIAAHWRYKEGMKGDAAFQAKMAWFRQLLEWKKEVVDAEAFVESLKTDIFKDQVYVFTPRGEIKELPAGATPLDFAYRIHTDVGHHCVGARVNSKMVSLTSELGNGDIVEILTSKAKRGPSRDWLNPNLGYVRTANAREKIRQWFKRQEREENVSRGREILERELKRFGLEQLRLDDIAKQQRFEKIDDLFAAVGHGEVNAQQLVAKLVAKEETETPAVTAPSSPTPLTDIQVMGVGDLLTRLARCCNPMPGDRIIGYITRGRGVTIHRADCRNLSREDERERLVDVEWGGRKGQYYPVTLLVEALDRVGLLRDISSMVADERVNMTSVTSVSRADRTVALHIALEVTGLDQLSRILDRLHGIRNVLDVRRETNTAKTA